jgi:hypothetical protein
MCQDPITQYPFPMHKTKPNIGVWIDHRDAVIISLLDSGDETKRILSAVEKQLRRSGEAPGPFEADKVPSDISRERDYTGHLAHYYDEIVSNLHEAGAILIFGPGEAKTELKKRFEKDKAAEHVIVMEVADKMTEPQMVAHVRHYFHHDAPRLGA